MLVYLDSGDIANLEMLSTKDPGAFDAFLDGWATRGCTLALSLHHAQEIAQLADEASRARRLSTLARFADIRYEAGGSYKVVWIEALAQLAVRLETRPTDYDRDVAPAFFQQAGLSDLTATVVDHGDQLRALEMEQAATADIRQSTRGMTVPRSYRKQTRDKVNLEGVASVAALTMAGTQLTPRTRAAVGPLLNAITTQMATSPNVRAAFEQAYNLGGLRVTRSVDDEDLHRVATFFSVAREVAAACQQEFTVDASQCDEALRSLDPYECPGVRIEMAVSRAQDMSVQAADASDEPDRAHVSFLPYVDAMFADRRTVGFLEQAAKAGRRADLVARYSGRLKRSGLAAHLLKALDLLAPNAAQLGDAPDGPSRRAAPAAPARRRS